MSLYSQNTYIVSFDTSHYWYMLLNHTLTATVHVWIKQIILATLPSPSQVVVKHAGRLFEVMLPDGHMIEFPNQQGLEVITYIRIKGDINLTSFKMKWVKCFTEKSRPSAFQNIKCDQSIIKIKWMLCSWIIWN